MDFKKFKIYLILFIFSSGNAFPCSESFELDQAIETAVKAQLQTLLVSEKIVPVVGNATLEDFQILVIGQEHIQQGDTEQTEGHAVTGKIINRFSKDGDLVLLEGVFAETKDVNPNGLSQIDHIRKISHKLRFRGWDHIGLHNLTATIADSLFNPELLPEEKLSDIETVKSMRMIHFWAHQRTIHMAERIKQETTHSKQRVIVTAGSIHADGFEGVLHQTLSQSGLKYLVLSAPNRDTRKNESQIYLGVGRTQEDLIRKTKMSVDGLEILMFKLLKGYSPEFQSGFVPREIQF